MTLKTVDEKIDDAVHAAVNALGLSVTGYADVADALNSFLTPIAKSHVTDDFDDEAADPVEHTFGIQIGRDARTYFSATTNGTLEGIMGRVTRTGFVGKINEEKWAEDGSDSFDEVETVVIYDTDTNGIFARRTSDGWEMDPGEFKE